MPTNTVLPSVALALLLAAWAGPTASAQAPATQARLTVGGETYTVPLGKPFAIRLGGGRVTMRIDPQSDQAFDEAGVAFRYPLGFQRDESEQAGGVTIWTLQGLSAAIVLQRYEGGLDPASLAEVLAQNTGDEAYRQSVRLNAKGRAFNGVQGLSKTEARGKAPASELLQNVFTFENSEGVFALLIQDARAPGAGDSAEYTEVLRLLSESLATGEAP